MADLQTLLAKFLTNLYAGVIDLGASALTIGTSATTTLINGVVTVMAGTGTGVGTLGGTLTSQVTPVSNTSIASEDVLMTYTLPASSLAVNGRGVRVTAAGSFAANANVKSARVYFGATLVATTANINGTPNNIGWHIVVEVVRSGATAQVTTSVIGLNATNGWNVTNTTPAETLSGAIVIKGAGFSATAATDVTQTVFVVELI